MKTLHISPASGRGAWLRHTILALALAGVVACALLLALSWLRPGLYAAWAREAVVSEAEQRLQESIPGIAGAATIRRVGARLANGKPPALLASASAGLQNALLREVRIFCMANGALLLCLALLAWCWTGPPRQLLAPACVLLGAGATVATIYALNQDWLQTILLGDYVGFWYFPYLLVAAAFMVDLMYNFGRVSLLLVEAVISVVGAAFAAVC